MAITSFFNDIEFYNENNKESIYSEEVINTLFFMIENKTELLYKYNILRERAKFLKVLKQFDNAVNAFFTNNQDYISNAGIEIWNLPLHMQKNNRPEEFPCECLPDVIKNYIKNIAEYVQVAPDMPAICVLSVLSLCIQGKAVISHMNTSHTESLNLYTAVIAKPAERKSGVYSILTEPVIQYEINKNNQLKVQIERYNDTKSLLENQIEKHKKKGDLKALNDARDELNKLKPIFPIKLNLNDVTAEALAVIMQENNEKMALLSDEGGLFDVIAGRYSNGIPNMDLYLKAYDGSPVSILRRSGYTNLYKPFLTMGFLVQQSVLDSILHNSSFTGRGFMQRFLYSFPSSKVGKRNALGKPLDENLKKDYCELITRLLNIDYKSEIPVIKMNDKACIMFSDFFDRVEKALAPSGELSEPAELLEWGGKLCGKVLRIAGIFHMCEHSPNELLDELTISRAIKAGEYFINHAKQIFTLESCKNAEDAGYVIAKFKEKDISEITVRELFNLCRARFKTVDQLKNVLDILSDNQYIKMMESLSNTSGRKSIKIKVNPLLKIK